MSTADRPLSRVLPDGCMDIVWDGELLLVAGPDTGPHESRVGVGDRVEGLRFLPGVAPGALGVPAHELRDLRVPLEDLWPLGRVQRLAALAERGGSLGAPEVVRLIGEALVEADDGEARARAAAVRALRGGAGVAEAASAAHTSERQLRRRSMEWFGYGPKMLGRILRFNRALALARGGASYGEAAAAVGYADQAHLAREVRSLGGAPLSVLLD